MVQVIYTISRSHIVSEHDNSVARKITSTSKVKKDVKIHYPSLNLLRISL